MVGSIAGAPDLAEHLKNLSRKDAAVQQSAQKFVLRFCR